MANQLPMTLRVYRKLSFAMMPLAPALIRQRLKQGKEDPARIGERRGMSQDVRPHGPLVWIHGASVGETVSLLPVLSAFARAVPGAMPDLSASGASADPADPADPAPSATLPPAEPADQAATAVMSLCWASPATAEPAEPVGPVATVPRAGPAERAATVAPSG